MKKTICLTLLSMLIIFILVMLTSCNEQTENDVNIPIPDNTTSESEKNDNHGQGSENSDNAYKDDPNFEYRLLPNGTYGISKLVNTAATEVTVPEYYNGKAVTKIMSNAFFGAIKLTSVTVKSNIQEIEKGAFSGCCSLKDITLPFIGAKQSSSEPLGYIFGMTPYARSQMVEQYITLSGQTWSKNFYIPTELKKVTVTGGTIKMYAFMNCTMIKELIFEDGVTAIESFAFLLCDGLESVSMGKSITEISDECFRFLTNLKSVSIGENVRKIGYYAFDGCYALKSIVIPKSVVIIERYAFDCCTGMESIIFECTTGWYRDYGDDIDTRMNVTNPVLNAKNLTDGREYSSDCWKRR